VLFIFICSVCAVAASICNLHAAFVKAVFAAFADGGALHSFFGAVAAQIALEPWLIPICQWIVYGFALVTVSTLYFAVNNALALKAERARTLNATKLAESARLKVLQSQLNPHFLFNALNGVATLIREQNGAAAATTVARLSDFLRSTLRTLDSPEISVAEELGFIDQYLQIERLRFGSRLRTQVSAEQDTLLAMLPTLILQPLVENAIRHGILDREKGGSLRISVRRSGDLLIAGVEDDGPGRAPGQQAYGVGLQNTEARLAALYGPTARMYIQQSTAGGFVVELQLPFRRKVSSQRTPASAEQRA
jgi:LytS/YehU family sensor histidine kinase